MTPVAFRLLMGHLRRSAWLYSGVGLMQFLFTDFYWKAGFPRVSVPAALLGMWGVATAIDKYNLVWRSLPLTNRDAGIFRWWAIAGAPGVWVTLCDVIAWASERTSSGVTAPPLWSLSQSILLGWAAIGVISILPVIRRVSEGRVGIRVVRVCSVMYVLWLLYGLPAFVAVQLVPPILTAVGLSLLAFSAREAARGRFWRWPDIASGARSERVGKQWSAEARFGVGVVLLPMLKQTLLVAVAASGGVILLYRLFPGAGAWLFWGFFLVISTTGFLLTYQVRSAIQILRILPLSARQLAARLQFFGALPGIVTLSLALLVNATVLHLTLHPLEFATFALIAVAAQALPIPMPRRNVGFSTAITKVANVFNRLYLPFYMGFIALNSSGAWSRYWWFRWPLVAAGIVLCVVGYYTLVRQVRGDMQPASNEGAFSAR